MFNKSSAIIGATAIGAVTQQTSNAYYGWLIISALFIVAIFILYFVDMEAAKLEMLHMEIQQELAQSSTADTVICRLTDGERFLEKVELIDDEDDHLSQHSSSTRRRA